MADHVPPTPHPNDNGEPPTEPPPAWIWDFGGPTEFAADGVTEIGVIEYWSYDNARETGTPATTPHVVRRFDSYDQDQIIARLNEPVPVHQGQPPSSGFQIAVLPCGDNLLPPLGTPGLDELNQVLGIPNHHHHYSSVRSGAMGMFRLPDNAWLFARSGGPDASGFTMMLRYNPPTNTTRGIFYSYVVFEAFENFISEFETCPHPLLLPLLALELTLNKNVYNLVSHVKTLEEMEGATGYGLLDGDGNQGQFQDYRTLVKSLSKARSGVHLSLATLRSTQWCVQFILKKLEFVNGRLSSETRDRLQGSSAMLEERVEFTLSTIDHALIHGGLKEQLEGQHSTLFNLITQNDSLLSTSIAQDSREIAAASKRDSSSMKIIAFLTTFFLPATFVATFFSMPLFNWDNASINHVATRHFWVFWALTAPLTLTIMAGVVAWALWHARNTRNTEKKARENFSQAIADEAQNLKRAATMRTLETDMV
ncbi:hypothetical protein BJX76DRAFT_357661 [Aspergillus varians]